MRQACRLATSQAGPTAGARLWRRACIAPAPRARGSAARRAPSSLPPPASCAYGRPLAMGARASGAALPLQCVHAPHTPPMNTRTPPGPPLLAPPPLLLRGLAVAAKLLEGLLPLLRPGPRLLRSAPQLLRLRVGFCVSRSQQSRTPLRREPCCAAACQPAHHKVGSALLPGRPTCASSAFCCLSQAAFSPCSARSSRSTASRRWALS